MARVKILSILVLLLVTGITLKPAPTPLSASKFYFPHFVSGNGNETTFIISNSSAQDAPVQITAYGDEGNLLQLRPNQASLTLTAQSQIQIRAGDLFDIPDGGMITGWLKAESTNTQLSAWMLISLGAIQGDRLDALAASDETSRKMAFSAVFETGDTITAIGLANPDNHTAHVKASLYSGGSIADVHEFQIPALGHRALFLNELFQANVPAGHVEIESDVGITGLQAFSQLDRWSAVPMQSAQDTSELLVPLPSLGKRFSATIALANLDKYDLNLSLMAYENDGTTVGPLNRVLKAHGELISSIPDLFGNIDAAGAVISIKADIGLLRIYGVAPALSALTILRGLDFNGLASFPVTAAHGESIFSPFSPQSSASLINGADRSGKIRLSMIDSGQKVVGENEMTVAGRTLVTGSISDLTKATQRGNLVLMSADQPMSSLQIESSDQGFFIIPGQTFKSKAVYASGQLVSRVSGGTVLSKDGAVSVSVPLNALKEDAAIQVNGLSQATAPPVDPSRRLLAATDFQPGGLEFLLPATIKMPLLKKQNPGSSIPLQSVNPAGKDYQLSASTALVAPDGLSVSAAISHFGILALTGEKPVVRVTPSRITLEVGQSTQLVATVSGNGIQDVDWTVDGVPGGTVSTGRIRPDGFYSAPAKVPPLGWVSVNAVSDDDPTASFEVQITIIPSSQPDAPAPNAPDPVVLSGPVDSACSGCHAYR